MRDYAADLGLLYPAYRVEDLHRLDVSVLAGMFARVDAWREGKLRPVRG